MTQEQKSYYTKISALSTIGFIIAIVIALKLGKKFWPVIGYSILGSLAGSAIGYLILKYPKSDLVTGTSSFGYDPNREAKPITINS